MKIQDEMLRQGMEINRGTRYIKKPPNQVNSTDALKSYCRCGHVKPVGFAYCIFCGKERR